MLFKSFKVFGLKMDIENIFLKLFKTWSFIRLLRWLIDILTRKVQFFVKTLHDFNSIFPLFYSGAFENVNTFKNAFIIKMLFLFGFLLSLIISEKWKNFSPSLYRKLWHLVMNITFFLMRLWLNRTFENWELAVELINYILSCNLAFLISFLKEKSVKGGGDGGEGDLSKPQITLLLIVHYWNCLSRKWKYTKLTTPFLHRF